MLDINDSIGTIWIEKGNNPRYSLYLFKCIYCENTTGSREHYLKKHSCQCRSCSSKKTIKCAQQANRLKPYESRYRIFIAKTKGDKIPTDLTYEDFLEFTKVKNCVYCDKIMKWTPYDNNPGHWLDRKYNDLGHIKTNLVVCCGICNMTKRDEFNYDEFMLLSEGLKKVRQNREKHLVDNSNVNDCPSGVCEI